MKGEKDIMVGLDDLLLHPAETFESSNHDNFFWKKIVTIEDIMEIHVRMS